MITIKIRFLAVLLLVSNAFSEGAKPKASSDAPKAESANPAQKGCGLVTQGLWKDRVSALNVSWHYSWNWHLPEGSQDAIAGVEFVPMIWGASKDGNELESRLKTVKASGARTLLGFNEPDNHKQSNIPVARALQTWPRLCETGLRIGSPAPTENQEGKLWLSQFLDKVEARHQPDFIAVHWYGNIFKGNKKVTTDHFEAFLRQNFKNYKKPLWVTEFAVADWKAPSNAITPEQTLEFMKLALPLLDRLAQEGVVERYAWFSGSDTPALDQSALFIGKTAELTPLGRFYRDYQPKIPRSK